MTLLFAGKKAKPQQGGAKPKTYPPDAARPNRQTKKIRKKKKSKKKNAGKGEGKEKFYNN